MAPLSLPDNTVRLPHTRSPNPYQARQDAPPERAISRPGAILNQHPTQDLARDQRLPMAFYRLIGAKLACRTM